MKTFKILIAISAVVAGCTNNSPKAQESPKMEVVDSNGFDKTLAESLGADDYGMKSYVIAFLKKGPNRNQDSAEAMELQMAHLNNIQRMADEGKLVVAGPMMDDGDIRGIYIFNVPSIEEAKELTSTDPAIKAGRLVMELHPWYSSAALVQVNSIHERISKESF